MPHVDPPALMWVTARTWSDAPLPELVGPAVAGGVDLIQVREPGLGRRSTELLIRAIEAEAGSSARLVVNSSIELARRTGIGVHLPENGPSIAEARSILGSVPLIGRSVHSPAAAAGSEGASYLVAGNVFETSSKPGKEPLGVDRFAEIAANAPAPVLAIGGITPARVPAIMHAGASGVAVLGPFTTLATVQDEAARFRAALEEFMETSGNRTVTATINGKPVTLTAGTTVADFLAGRELHERLVVVERNGEIITRSTFPQLIIEEGDLLEIVHFVGGG